MKLISSRGIICSRKKRRSRLVPPPILSIPINGPVPTEEPRIPTEEPILPIQLPEERIEETLIIVDLPLPPAIIEVSQPAPEVQPTPIVPKKNRGRKKKSVDTSSKFAEPPYGLPQAATSSKRQSGSSSTRKD
jgi:hypothetical protein